MAPRTARCERRRTGEVGGWIAGVDLNPGALTGVWATSNTRGAIWDAMKAKETFATSGVRIKVRMFAGFDLPGPDANPTAMVENGYRAGVPMGGTLPSVAAGEKRPLRINVLAMKGPKDANLDRIQIIKGWIAAEASPRRGSSTSPGRATASRLRWQAAGRRQHRRREDCHLQQSVGSAELTGSWVDDQFDPARSSSITRACCRSRRRAGAPMTRSAPSCPCSRRRGDRAGARVDLADLVHAGVSPRRVLGEHVLNSCWPAATSHMAPCVIGALLPCSG